MTASSVTVAEAVRFLFPPRDALGSTIRRGCNVTGPLRSGLNISSHAPRSTGKRRPPAHVGVFPTHCCENATDWAAGRPI
jgi:hypothetical protein